MPGGWRLHGVNDGDLAVVGMGASRYAWGLYVERKLRPDAGQAAHVLAFGAGKGAEQAINASATPSALHPRGAARRKARTCVTWRSATCHGGHPHRHRKAAAEHDAQALLIAIPPRAAS